MAGLGDIRRKPKQTAEATALFEHEVVPGTRGNVFPAAQYTDGEYHLAWPEVLATPARAIWDSWDAASYAGRNNDPETTEEMARLSFDAASAAPLGGVAAGVAGAVPEGAVAANGIGRAASHLPMDEASRMTRAKEMGFDTATPYYHGTPENFDSFKPGHAFITPDKTMAEDFGSRVVELRSSHKKPFMWEATDFSNGGANHTIDRARGVLPNLTPYGDTWEMPGTNQAKEFYAALEANGYDALVNTIDGIPEEIVVLNAPRNLRSVNAAFDPANKDSGNLLYSNSPTGASVPLAFSEDPQAEGYKYGGFVDRVKGWEGYYPKPYWDYKQWTSGYGTRASGPNEVISREEADARLNAELTKARAIVDAFAPDAPEGAKQMLTSLTFNAGDKWTRSGLGQAVRGGDWDAARNLFGQYNKAGGQTLPGLVKRRGEELALFDAPASESPTLAQSAPQGDFFADKPLTLAGNEMPAWGPPMALGGPEEQISTPNYSKISNSSPGPFNAQSYRVSPENQTKSKDFMSGPTSADWVQGPLGLMPKYSDGAMPLQGFKDGGRVLGGLGDLRVAKPTDAQKEAGNYKKAHVNVQGLDITIENTKGSERSGIDKGGKRWSVKLPDHYGYFKRTLGYDGDHVDCYVGPEPEAEKAYVIDQVDAETGKFDEHKVMLGYASEAEARDAYSKAFNDGKAKDRLGHLTPMPVADLKDWLMNGDTKRPLGPQKFACGGAVGYATGGEVSLQPGYSGHLLSDIAGRTDEIPLEVSSGSYIVPADCVSALGEGNTLAGTKVLQSMFPAEAPSLQFSTGGRVPIIVAGGEYALSPEQVAKIGGGDLNAGHSALDEWVKAVRAHTIQTLSSLPPPATE